MLSTDEQPEAEAQGKSTREDWLQLALETLIRDGIDRVKVQIMAKQLNVSRSSFYWFFKSPQDLNDQMLDYWLTKNTGPIIQRALRPAQTITEAILNVFECWANADLFDPRLDIAVRLWARRDANVLAVVTGADQQRLDALTGMFTRHGFPADEALVRARVLYFTQVGQYTLDIKEDMALRFSRTRNFVRAFSGQSPTDAEIEHFKTAAFG
ncbi:TetR/AcrR family transcriptional regulator [Tabrizicola oligotrophica]|uniref:TetR/AcrR family transcriptional regulator n=1 Tax=Tabrizicola oligotrophica TaxID=2710650 RepID=A0A6M0QR33_9RHOB|nr:TetR/AcrR family transcriptional regulator [Tabrizicola oligotrophica]NEY89511.1 TetR/AcrR family transcriptional regulator [Tabrizicola oligotrophica]